MNKKQKILYSIFGYQYISLGNKAKKKRSFCHNDIMNLITRVENRKFDFSSSLGHTIREKYESLYVFLYECTNELGKSGNYFPDIIIADQRMSFIFECSSSSLNYNDEDEIVKIKNVNNRWDLYRDLSLPHDTILLTNKHLLRGIVITTNFSEFYGYK